MAKVILENVSKRFPNGTTAVDQLNLEIRDGEFLVIIGPSGCGKSTTLRLIAGLETPTSGEVAIGSRVVTHDQPKGRDIAMVFQSHALYPHLSVYQNMAFGLSLRSGIRNFGGEVFARGLRKIFQPHRAAELNRLQGEIDNKVQQAALKLGIEKLLDRKPHQLSGGECQRVALGRAIVRNPAAFLLDEPLSNLDTKLRRQMRVELKRLHQELQTTTVYVTHDQVEAMTLGDRVAVMNDGRVLQIGKPLEVYQRPANLFVANLMGNTPLNCLRGTVTQNGETLWFQHLSNGVEIELQSGVAGFETLGKRFENSDLELNVVLGFRAEDVKVDAEAGQFEVEVTQITDLGDSSIVESQLCGNTVEQPKQSSEQLTTKSDDNLKHDHQTVWVKRGFETNLNRGDQVKLKVTLDRLMWFDPETGDNLVRDKI